MRALLVIALVAGRVEAGRPATDVIELPDGTDPVGLVVVLHGDRERAPAAAARWRAAVKRRGWALVALQCPADLGCKASFWQWNGDPSWITDRVADVARRRAIDPARVFLVGWSGGASYIGAHAAAWSSVFAAVVIHGGGMAPPSDACPDPALAAYFLVGDRNPLHRLARQLRDFLDSCDQEPVWDVVAGADHGKEAAALTEHKAEAIVTWLEAHRRGH